MAKVFENTIFSKKAFMRQFETSFQSKKDVFVLMMFACFAFVNLLMITPIDSNIVLHRILWCFKLVIIGVFAIDCVWDFFAKRLSLNYVTIILGLCAVLTLIITKQPHLCILFILLVCASKYKFKDIARVVGKAFLFCLLFMLILCLCGAVENIYVLRDGIQRFSYGFSYPTNVLTILLFYLLLKCCYDGRKTYFVEILLYVLIACLFYYLTDSRCDFYLCILVCAILFAYKLFKKDYHCKILYNNVTKYLLMCVPFVLFIVSVVCYNLFLNGNALMLKLDEIISYRFVVMQRLLDNYPLFTLFGNEIPIYHPTIIDGQVIHGIDYAFVDNSYYSILVRFGIINLFMSLVLYSFLIKKSIEKKNFLLLLCCFICLLDGLLEYYLIEYLFNYVILFAAPYIVKRNVELNNYGFKVVKMAEKRDVCAVVVTYNRKVLLKENIQALLKQAYKDLKVLVIDNASTDGTKEYIKDLVDEKKVFYFNTGANLGGAGGFNYGMKQAVLLGCDYVWIMDDDCIPNESSLKALVDNAQSLKDDFGYLSSKVLWTDGTPCVMNVQKTSLWSKVDINNKGLTKIKLASFVSLFLKRETVEEFGLPIKDFFIWGDDWEYTNRISSKRDCYYCPESVVIHKCAKNFGVDISKEDTQRIDRYKYAYRNECYFYKKNGISGVVYVILKTWLHTFRVLFSKAQDKGKRIKIIHHNTKLGFKFNPKIEYVFNEKTPVNVLEFFGEPLEYGGQEAFWVNMYQNCSAKNITYTIATPFNLTNEKLIRIAEKRKENIIHFDYKFFSKARKISIIKALKKLLKEKKYDVVHIQSGSIFTLYFCARIAKKIEVKKVIVHSHCTGKMNLMYKLIKKYSDAKIEKCTNEFFACSLLAGKHKFPKKVMEEDRCTVIKNGIDSDRFKFKQETRKKYREKLGLKPGEFTLLHVGRFSEQKNHPFIIKIVEELKEQVKNFKFILIGDGENKEQTLKEIKDKGLEKYFIILEKRNDVAEIMMAADMFVFPSIFEGLGIVAVEAQCSGLQTIVSKEIPEEANITDLITYLDLNVDAWVQAILKKKGKKPDREKYAEIVLKQGFDAKESAAILEKIYLGEE